MNLHVHLHTKELLITLIQLMSYFANLQINYNSPGFLFETKGDSFSVCCLLSSSYDYDKICISLMMKSTVSGCSSSLYPVNWPEFLTQVCCPSLNWFLQQIFFIYSHTYVFLPAQRTLTVLNSFKRFDLSSSCAFSLL